MQNPDRAETISQNAAYLQRFVIFYSFVSSSLPRVRKRADVCRRTINIKETQKHEKPSIFEGFPMCSILWNKDGGDGEIRTLELVSELHDFQS